MAHKTDDERPRPIDPEAPHAAEESAAADANGVQST